MTTASDVTMAGISIWMTVLPIIISIIISKLALQPLISPLIETDKLVKKTVAVQIFGADLKSVDGIGDRSAYGLPDEKGVVIVNAGSNSLFSKSGFMNRDVIRTVQGKIIGNIQHLMEVFRSEQGTSTLSIQIVREQKIFQRELKIK